MNLQTSEQNILRELQRDATLSNRELADRVALSPSTVWRRVQELEAAGIITGRVTLADPDRLGLEVCNLVQINIKEQTAEARADFERLADINGNILQCFSVTGGHDYMLVVRTRTIKEFQQFLMQVILAHPSVRSTESNLVLQQHKNTTVLPI